MSKHGPPFTATPFSESTYTVPHDDVYIVLGIPSEIPFQ